ncbi:hypothetical protein GCM10027614_18730 [Micromonospora vulcania]
MADPHDDLTAIVDEVRRVTTLPTAQHLRRRSEERRRRRAAITATGLAVLVGAAGTTLLAARNHVEAPVQGVGPAGVVAPSTAPPVTAPPLTAPPGPQDILAGRRQVLIGMPGLAGAVLAIGRTDDQVRATTERGIDDRALWVLRPRGTDSRSCWPRRATPARSA